MSQKIKHDNVSRTFKGLKDTISVEEFRKMKSGGDFDFLIGVDCGVKTGFAVYFCNGESISFLDTLMIHKAMDYVKAWFANDKIKVIVEDARQVKFNTSAFKAQGAGSVKRDAKIWEDFLTDMKIPFEMVRPKKAITKLDAAMFKQVTGWQGRTDSHSRDAAMLVFGK